MPERYAIGIDHPNPAAVTGRQLHAVVSKLLDSDHWANDKPYAISPLYEGPDGVPTFEIGGLVDEVGEKLYSGVANWARSGLRLGADRCHCISPTPQIVASKDWGDLADVASAASDLVVEFETATMFRQGNISHPVPLASSVVASWNKRWRRFAPEELAKAVDLDVSKLKVAIAHLDGKTIEVEEGGRVSTGFVGGVVYRNYESGSFGTSVSRRLLALARIAEFVGTGSMTTQGFGVTSLR